MASKYTPACFSRIATLLAFIVIGLFSANAVSAQNAAAPDPKGDLKTSLSSLSTLYKQDVERLEKQQQQSKALYQDGLISRVEFENGEKVLADARAKVDQVAKDIATANQPVPVITGDIGSNMIVSGRPWSSGNGRIDSLIRYYGSKYGVDPYLIFCTMSQESGFTSGATSPKGALGLMQLMPDTAARYGVTNPYDIAQSIMGGTRYLKDLLTMFNGRVDLALAGYNAGEGAVMKYGNAIPPYSETRNYVKLILARYGKKSTS